MSSIRTDRVALDTNEIVHALRRTPEYESCADLFFGHANTLRIYLPLQVTVELHRNLSPPELNDLFIAVRDAQTFEWGFAPAPADLLDKYHKLGAKKGDAVIAAQIEAEQIPWLVTENRRFLADIPDLPFTILTAAEALRLLG